MSDSMILRYGSIVTILITLTVAGPQLVGLRFAEAASSTSNPGQNLLEIRFANNVAESYSVMVNSNEKYTVDQSYSWVRDESSRYNLVSYSLDNGNSIEIPRKARG